MAYLKIFPIKVTDKKALDYITNPDKTDEKLLVSSFGCSPETADLEFSMTREMAKKNGMDKGDNLAFHLIQSFKPGEVDAETAHRLGQQFADEVVPDAMAEIEYSSSTTVTFAPGENEKTVKFKILDDKKAKAQKVFLYFW